MTKDQQQIAEALASNRQELIELKHALHSFATELGRTLKYAAARGASPNSIKWAFENAEAAAKRLAAKLS